MKLATASPPQRGVRGRARGKMSTRQKGELALEIVPRPVMVARGGRKPVGWMGGARVMEEVERAPAGMAVRMPLPEAVPYDRVRWGIYAAARLRRLPVSIVRQGGFVHIWRLGYQCSGS